MKSQSKHKNYALTFVLLVLLWLFWLVMLFFIPPLTFGRYVVFISMLFAAASISFSFVLISARRGIMVGVFIIGILLLNQYGLSSIVNIILFAGLLVSVEIYARS